MRLLITGADGFTGRHLAAAALEAGHEVHALKADLLQPDAVREEVLRAAPELVAHLAAVSFVGHEQPLAFYGVNIFGTLHLLDALRELPSPPGRVLLASSANVYGNCAASPIAEEQPPAPVNHYAASKLAMEHLARTRQTHLPLFFTRPFNYTGVGQAPQFVIPKLVQHYAARSAEIELGNTDVQREFNDVRFVCATYLRLLERAQPGATYNICTAQTWSLLDVMRMLEELTGHRPRVRTRADLVRANEIGRLCGNPDRLDRCVGELPRYPLRETLAWMLQHAKDSGTGGGPNGR